MDEYSDERPHTPTTYRKYFKKQVNEYAVALGRLGGLKGGKARAEKLTPLRKAQIAKKAALARWQRKKED